MGYESQGWSDIVSTHHPAFIIHPANTQMSRIKIRNPSRYIFTTSLDVRISDINYGKHLSNDAMLRMAHEARVQFLKDMNYEEYNVDGVGIILTQAVICYKLEVVYPAALQWRLAVELSSRASVDIIYHVSCVETKREVATLSTTATFFDYEKRKVSTIPKGFLEKVAAMIE